MFSPQNGAWLVVTVFLRDSVQNLANYIEHRAVLAPISSAINAYPARCLMHRR